MSGLHDFAKFAGVEVERLAGGGVRIKRNSKKRPPSPSKPRPPRPPKPPRPPRPPRAAPAEALQKLWKPLSGKARLATLATLVGAGAIGALAYRRYMKKYAMPQLSKEASARRLVAGLLRKVIPAIAGASAPPGVHGAREAAEHLLDNGGYYGRTALGALKNLLRRRR